jgi:hypothetical protein
MELNAHLYSTRGWAFREESDNTPAVRKNNYLNFQELHKTVETMGDSQNCCSNTNKYENTEIVVALYAITGDALTY